MGKLKTQRVRGLEEVVGEQADRPAGRVSHDHLESLDRLHFVVVELELALERLHDLTKYFKVRSRWIRLGNVANGGRHRLLATQHFHKHMVAVVHRTRLEGFCQCPVELLD